MAALFSRRADTLARAVIATAFGLALGVPTGLLAWVRSPHVTGQGVPVEQPVLFDHRHHVLDAGIDCRYCHATADRSRYAGVPATSVCMGCHAQIWTSSALLEPVIRSFREAVPIEWRRVHRLPSFVYFDHASHVNGGVACATCHGRVELMAQVHQEAPLTMRWCLDCHREQGRALTHCSTCHR